MDLLSAFEAAVLGVVEGLTEYIPVSSTAHLLLAAHFIGFESSGKTFEVVIQLGAILSLLLVYAGRLWQIAAALPTSAEARRFVLAVLVAFLPAAIVGALAHGFIKDVLFHSLYVICIALIVGGFILLWVDKLPLQPKYVSVYDYPIRLAFYIGLIQCISMIPGVSRSGSTIVGALLLGTDKRSAAEFSFFLAMPTMAGAFVLDFYKSRHDLNFDDIGLIAIGFVFAFISGIFVVRTLLDFVSRRGYAFFAWWRIVIGAAALVGLTVLG